MYQIELKLCLESECWEAFIQEALTVVKHLFTRKLQRINK